jgi:3-isopropylmalate/(R)-2-methylmalate dehydratase large subunit
MNAPLTPMTLAEKIVARVAGANSVTPGEIVTCKVDLAMIHDSGGPRRVKPILEQLGVGVWAPDKVVLISDHYVPAVDAISAAILDLTRKWAAANKIKNFYDMQGICHVVLPERGHLKPGMFVVGGDSHSPTGGAYGCFMFGVGATDMAGVLATGETWIKVPETIRIACEGDLPSCVSAKDMILALCAKMGMGGGKYQVVEYVGSTIKMLGITERMTLCNMAAELGAMTGLIAPDEVTASAIASSGRAPDAFDHWRGDDDAHYLEEHGLDVSGLSPQVALPHSPANATDVENVTATPIDQAYLGACTGAKLEDLHMAASVLKGRLVARGTRLLVAPASTRITQQAAADGTLETLTAAGAIIMPSGCGACAGYGAGVLADEEVCIASTARNFKGRMGSSTSRVYLGSPYTVAASAIAGAIADPRDVFSGADA